MLMDLKDVKIFVRTALSSMRLSDTEKAVIIKEEMRQDVFSGNLFIFCSINKKILNILYWDRNGFCHWNKKLLKGHFPWPKNPDRKVIEITKEQLAMLLNGIDFFNAHKALNYFELF